jgi:hypothetical protein
MARELRLVPERLAGWRVLRELPADARRAGLVLVPLRPRSRDADTALSGGDYDFLMPPEGFETLIGVLFERAAAERASFSVRRVRAHKVEVFLHVPEAERSIALEIWTRLEVRDPARRSARCVNFGALAVHVETGGDEPRLAPSLEIAYYLSHLATREKDLQRPLVRERLARYRELARARAPEMLSMLDGIDSLGVGPTAELANAFLRRTGVLAGRSRLQAWLESVGARFASSRRAARRRRVARSRVVAITGPDGSGKSTVIESWRGLLGESLRHQRFKGLFRHHPAYQVLHALRARRATGGGDAPMAKNRFDEQHARALFAIARSSWPFFRLLVLLTGRRCLDRGFPDLLFARLRDPSAVPALHAEWRAMARRMPQPDWHVHLDAPHDVVRARKQELSLEALRGYRSGMAQIVGAAPCAAFTRLDTSTSLDATLASLRLAARALGVNMLWRTGA